MMKLKVHIEKSGYEEGEAAIENISFAVGEGELVGLIGPNGAGKSTTIKTILGLTRHMAGQIEWPETSNYAYIPEQPSFYDELTLWEHITALGTFLEEDESSFLPRANRLRAIFAGACASRLSGELFERDAAKADADPCFSHAA